jgi:hypothetical protein
MSLFLSTGSAIATIICITIVGAAIYRLSIRAIVERQRKACVSRMPTLFAVAENHIFNHGDIVVTMMVEHYLTSFRGYRANGAVGTVSYFKSAMRLLFLQLSIDDTIVFLMKDARREHKDPKKECVTLVRFGLMTAIASIEHSPMLSRAARRLLSDGKEIVALNKNLDDIGGIAYSKRHAELLLLELKLSNFALFS